MGESATGVPGDSLAVERLLVGVDAALPPGQQPQRTSQKGTKCGGRRLIQGDPPGRESQRGCYRNDDCQACQVLEMVGDIGVPEREHVQEA